MKDYVYITWDNTITLHFRMDYYIIFDMTNNEYMKNNIIIYMLSCYEVIPR
jgi:hypothetical protein